MGLDAFMNGERLTTKTTSTKVVVDADSSDPWKVSLGANDRFGTKAMSPVVVADFVSWPRYLYLFEIHHLMGMTGRCYSI